MPICYINGVGYAISSVTDMLYRQSLFFSTCGLDGTMENFTFKMRR